MKIEQVKCKGLYPGNSDEADTSRAPRHNPMTIEESQTFMQLSMIEMTDVTPPPDVRAALLSSPIIYIITKRIEQVYANWEEVASLPAVTMLSDLVTTTGPARAVMWAYTLLYMRALRGQTITLSILSDIFPFGFPNEEDLRKVWESQKCEVGQRSPGATDNMLDKPEWWLELASIIKHEKGDDVEA